MGMTEPIQHMKYRDLPAGNFFRIALRPDLGRFFKCEPWISTTEDLEKLVNFKEEIDVVLDQKGPLYRGRCND